jgi:hypothetical protein
MPNREEERQRDDRQKGKKERDMYSPEITKVNLDRCEEVQIRILMYIDYYC